MTKEYFLLESRRSSHYHGQRQTEAKIDAERGGETRCGIVAVARFHRYSLYNGTHFSFRKVNLIVQRDSTQQWGSRTKVIDHKANPYDSVGSSSLGSS